MGNAATKNDSRNAGFWAVDGNSGVKRFVRLADHTPRIALVTVGTARKSLTNSDLASHAINQLLGIVADPGLKHCLDVLDLINSF